MKVRSTRAEPGTCHAEGCSQDVHRPRRKKPLLAPCGEPYPVIDRAFCEDHARVRDLELSTRNARGEAAELIRLADWERGPDGRARLKDGLIPLNGETYGLLE